MDKAKRWKMAAIAMAEADAFEFVVVCILPCPITATTWLVTATYTCYRQFLQSGFDFGYHLKHSFCMSHILFQ